jgi:hypothetical protein
MYTSPSGLMSASRICATLSWTTVAAARASRSSHSTWPRSAASSAVHDLHRDLRRRVEQLREVRVGHVAAAEVLLQVELPGEDGVQPILRVEIRG